MHRHLSKLLLAAGLATACGDGWPPPAPAGRLLASDNSALSLSYSCSDSTASEASSALVRGVVVQEVSEHILAEMTRPGGATRAEAVRRARQSGDAHALERAVVAYVCAHGPPPRRAPRFPEPGSVAAEFVLSPLAGEADPAPAIRLSEHRGRPVILTFWSSWCGPCRTGYPDLQRLAGHAASRGVAHYAVVHRDQPENVRDWVQEHGSGVRFVLDKDERVATQYHVYGIPHTVLIGADGRVLESGSGYLGAGRDLTRLVSRALGE